MHRTRALIVAVLGILSVAQAGGCGGASAHAGRDDAGLDAAHLDATESLAPAELEVQEGLGEASDLAAPGEALETTPSETASPEGTSLDGTAVELDALPGDLAPYDVAPPPDVAATPDCSAIAAHADWQLCVVGPGSCSAVFGDGAGCAAVCAAAGLVCHAVFENIDEACAPDVDRPPLACAPESGHQSDFCYCVPVEACGPSCAGKACGDDGCGGSCGVCPEGVLCGSDHLCAGPAGPDCSAPFDAASLYAELVGFAGGTTGGDPAQVYPVTSKEDSGPGTLRDALESTEPWWIVFEVEGDFVFDFDDSIEVQSHKTVDGRGRQVRLWDARFDIKPGVHDLIFSDFEAAFVDPQDGEGDLFGLRGPGGDSPDDYTTHHVWFHHLDLHHAGDGLIDVRGATQVTISWCHFHDHTKVMLHTSDTDGEPSPGMRITYHHNFFDTVTRRGPHFAYGLADFFNNYQYHWYEYGAACIDEGRFLSEANIYEAREGSFCVIPCPDPSPHGGGNDFVVSKKALSTDWAMDQTEGFTRSVGDWLLNGAQVDVNQADEVFERSDFYAATVVPANDVLRQAIVAGAGPRVGYCEGE